jgi:hypothetical protein
MSVPYERRAANTAENILLPKLRAAFARLNAAGTSEIKPALVQIGDNGKGNPMRAFGLPADAQRLKAATQRKSGNVHRA